MPRQSVVIAALLLGIVPIIYRGVWSADFVYEDRNATAFLEPQPLPIQPLRIRSLTRVSYRIDRWVSGDHPLMYHLSNLAIHTVNGGLVIALALGLGLAFPAALLAGAIFLLHPLQSEAVYYIAGRTELLATCGVLLGCHAVLRHAYRWAFVAFVAAVAAKESAVIGLGLFALVHYARRGWDWRTTMKDLRVYALCLLPVAGITTTVFRYEYIPAIRSPLTYFEYMRLQATAVWAFLGMFVVPAPGMFSVDHDFEIVGVGWQIAALTLLVAAAGYILYRGWRSPSWQVYGLWWFAIAIAPRFIMRIPEVLNEHQLYLGMAGISISLGQTLFPLIKE